MNVHHESRIDILENIEENMFDLRSAIVNVGIPTNSGELEFVPLSKSSLQDVRDSNVLVRLVNTSIEEQSENLVAVDNVFQMSKSSLVEFLNDNR